MSAYECPGCGGDAPLSQECPRCEKFATPTMIRLNPVDWHGRVISRLAATRAQLLQEMQEHTQSLAMLRDEARRERTMGEKLRQDLGNLHIRLAAALSDADECRRLRDLAIKSLEARTKELMGADNENAMLRREIARLAAPTRPIAANVDMAELQAFRCAMEARNVKAIVPQCIGLKLSLDPSVGWDALTNLEGVVRLTRETSHDRTSRRLADVIRAIDGALTPLISPGLDARIVAARQHLEACKEALRNEEGRGVRYDGMEEARDSAKEALQELLDEQKEASNAQ